MLYNLFFTKNNQKLLKSSHEFDLKKHKKLVYLPWEYVVCFHVYPMLLTDDFDLDLSFWSTLTTTHFKITNFEHFERLHLLWVLKCVNLLKSVVIRGSVVPSAVIRGRSQSARGQGLSRLTKNKDIAVASQRLWAGGS